MKKDDPIVAEIRAIRDEYAARHGYDVTRIFADIKARQKESGRNYVQYPPRPASRKLSQRQIDNLSQTNRD